MRKSNCWEYKECGRQPGGKNVDKSGVCPASTEQSADGINSGTNGGRACWAIAGTLSENTPEAGSSENKPNCFHCSFYTKVLSEEGVHFESSSKIHKILKNKKGETVNAAGSENQQATQNY